MRQSWEKMRWQVNEMDKWAAFQLETIFYNSSNGRGPRGSWSEYVELAKYLNNGWITVEKQEYGVRQPSELEKSLDEYKLAFVGNATEEHGMLKWTALHWLIDRGANSL